MPQPQAMDLFSFQDQVPAPAEKPVAKKPAKTEKPKVKIQDPVTVTPAAVTKTPEIMPQPAQEQDSEPPAARTPGRPRSESSRSAILDATRRLVSHTSIRDLSIEGIAKKAGVGKTTIYRWWPNKVAVVIEAFSSAMDMNPAQAGADTPADAMARHLERLLRQLRGRNGKIIADLIAEAQCDKKVMAQLDEFYMAARRAEVETLIRLGQEDGVFNADLRSDIAVDMVLGPVFLRLMSGEDGLDDGFAMKYPQMALVALRAA